MLQLTPFQCSIRVCGVASAGPPVNPTAQTSFGPIAARSLSTLLVEKTLSLSTMLTPSGPHGVVPGVAVAPIRPSHLASLAEGFERPRLSSGRAAVATSQK